MQTVKEKVGAMDQLSSPPSVYNLETNERPSVVRTAAFNQRRLGHRQSLWPGRQKPDHLLLVGLQKAISTFLQIMESWLIELVLFPVFSVVLPVAGIVSSG